MDPYTSAHFAVQDPADTASASSSAMNIDPKAEVSGTPGLDIKRETSSGLDGDVSMSMADIPDLAGAIPTPISSKSEPRSSQPPPSISGGGGGGGSPPKPPGASRAAKKKGTATLVKKTSNRKSAGGSRAGRGVRGSSKTAASSSSRPAGGGGRGGKKSSLGPGSTLSASSPPPAPPGSSEVGSGASDDESDHGPYCICRGPDDHRWMIGCDVCEDWFHGECVGVDKVIGEALIVRYVCPGCTDDKGVNVTRYKKTCSLEGCCNAARIYEEGGEVARRGLAPSGNYSVFCSDKHAEEWWEALVRSLPENGRLKAKGADLTRERFMGLLNVSNMHKSVEEEPWHIWRKPFGKMPYPLDLVPHANDERGLAGGDDHFTNKPPAVPSDFWSKVDHTLVLTPEERSFLSTSAADRYALAEEIVLNKKMQQLLDLANERRKAAIAAGLFDKDTCGYDARLDLVGVPVEFATFVKSPQGEVIYKGSSLAAEGSWTEEQLRRAREDAEAAGRDFSTETACMCDRRRCKPHASWYNIFTKSTRHVIKELARQAKEQLDAETRVREAAATRYFRRRHERTAVMRLDGLVDV